MVKNTLLKFKPSFFIFYFLLNDCSIVSCFLMLANINSNFWAFSIFVVDIISIQCILCSFSGVISVLAYLMWAFWKVCKLQILRLATFPGPSFKAGRLIYDGHLLLAIVHQNVGMSWGKLLSGRQSQLICLSIKF